MFKRISTSQSYEQSESLTQVEDRLQSFVLAYQPEI